MFYILNLLYTSAHLLIDLDFIYSSHPGIHRPTLTFIVFPFNLYWIFDLIDFVGLKLIQIGFCRNYVDVPLFTELFALDASP